MCIYPCFFFNDTATTEIYTLSLHDALPICGAGAVAGPGGAEQVAIGEGDGAGAIVIAGQRPAPGPDVAVEGDAERSEEHTSELQSRQYLVCRLLLEKKKKTI